MAKAFPKMVFDGRIEGMTAAAAIVAHTFVTRGVTQALRKTATEAGAGAIAAGIATTEAAAAGDEIGVATDGRGQLTVDGSGTAIVPGDRLKSDATGFGVKVAADEDWYGAIALEASAVDGTIIEVEIVKGFHAVA